MLQVPIARGTAVLVLAMRALTTALLFVAVSASVSCGADESPSPTPETPAPSSTATSTDAAAGGGVFIADLDGNVSRIAGGDGYAYFGPAWSPVNTLIAVSRESDLVLLDVGAEPRILTRNGRSNYLPAWSRDGTVLVFVSQEGDDTSTAELYRINADGTEESRLTQDGFWDYSASWVSDTAIIFGSQQDGDWRIFTIDDAGGAARPLSFDAAGNAPAVSPDGRSVAFTSDRDGDDDIWIMAPDGSNQRSLTSNDAHDDNAAWSPDGSSIAFSSDRSGKNEIYVMNADGTGVRQVTNDTTLIPDIPSWSPDGTRIVFAARSVQE